MKGICFKEHLFNATVNKTKTQTRRIVTPEPDNIRSVNKSLMKDCVDYFLEVPKGTPQPSISFLTCENKYLKPRYLVGEVIYLKEPYYKAEDGSIQYRYQPSFFIDGYVEAQWKWSNKLFMPESAARFFIKITAVRAERLQSIPNEDCIKEGIELFTKDNVVHKYGVDGWKWQDMPKEPREAYAMLINKINGKGTWESNPFVWVYDYELIDK